MKPANAQRNSYSQWLVIVFLLGLFLLLFGVAPRAQASYTASPSGQAAASTPTLGPSDSSGSGTPGTPGTPGAPQPVGTAQAGLTATANAVGPVSTGAVPQGVSTGVVAPQGGASGNTANSSSSSGGSFPWLIVIGLALLVLAGIGFALMRPRRTVEVASGPGAPRASGLRTVPAPGARTAATTSATTAATQQANPGNRTAATAAAATPVAQQATTPLAPAPLPATVKCPNCGTINSTDEKFCHECGQDLRPVVAQMASTAAAAAQPTVPVDVIDDTTPYLETLDRTSEQLEFVLSRPKIGIGTAPGNDIIIDNAFKGWQTVSPRHAEMRRDQDGFVIADLGSEYGTFVNEMRTGENLLANGDLIRLGDVRFIFHIPTAED